MQIKKIKTEWVCVKELLFHTSPVLVMLMRFLAAIAGGISLTYFMEKILSLANLFGALETIFLCEWLAPIFYVFGLWYAFSVVNVALVWRNFLFVTLVGRLIVGGFYLFQ